MLNYIAQYDPKQIKRDVRRAVLCVVAFIITLNVVVSIVVLTGMMIDSKEIFFEMSSYGSSAWEQAYYQAYFDATEKYGGLGYVIGILCGLPWFFLFRGKRFFVTDVARTNSKVKPTVIIFAFVLILGIQFIYGLPSMLYELTFGPLDSSGSSVLDESMTALSTSFWGILYIVLVGPIFEELVFRGAVMRTLEKYGANFAIVVSALLFGLYHMYLTQAIFAFFVGIVLAYVAGRFSIKWAMLLHILNNGIAVLSMVLASPLYDMALGIAFAVGFVISIIVLILKRNKLAMQKVAGAPSQPRVYARAFSSPWLIAYIALCGFACIFTLFIM